MKGEAVRVLDAGRIDAALRQNGFVLRGEVPADNANHANIGEITGGKREVSGGATQNLFGSAGGGREGVKGDRADYKNAHAGVCLSCRKRMSSPVLWCIFNRSPSPVNRATPSALKDRSPRAEPCRPLHYAGL